MIYIGADHAGFPLKEKIKQFLEKKKLSFQDLSKRYNAKDDYPDITKRVALAVKKNNQVVENVGILVCGTGIGIDIAANRFKGIRAAPVYDEYTAVQSRTHNDANIICLRGRKFPAKYALKLVDLFLKTPFSGEQRHKRRIKKLDTLP